MNRKNDARPSATLLSVGLEIPAAVCCDTLDEAAVRLREMSFEMLLASVSAAQLLSWSALSHAVLDTAVVAVLSEPPDEALQNQLLERGVQDGVMVVDSGEQVRQWNPQAEALLGAHPPPRPDLAAFSVALAGHCRNFRNGTKERVATLRVPGSGALLRARFVHAGASGDVLIYLEDMGRIQQQAQQMKLAALGRLTANIAHEIRNPLSAISHAAELLREEKRTEGQQRLSRIINDNAQRLERLVRDVLELGRRDKTSQEQLRLAGFLESFLDEMAMHEQVDRSVFSLSLDSDPALLFDRTHLNQVLWNLFSNALRYCSGRPGAVRIEVRDLPSSERVELHIMDDGAGVGEEARGKIFEPFFTTHSRGTGLGLYIARELCEANDALLEWVDNQPGAHFRIIGRNQRWQENQNAEDSLD